MSRATNTWHASSFYIRDSADGTYTAYVNGRGFRANDCLANCLAFIREMTGLNSGAVPFWDRELDDWGSEFDLAEGAK